MDCCGLWYSNTKSLATHIRNEHKRCYTDQTTGVKHGERGHNNAEEKGNQSVVTHISKEHKRCHNDQTGGTKHEYKQGNDSAGQGVDQDVITEVCDESVNQNITPDIIEGQAITNLVCHICAATFDQMGKLHKHRRKHIIPY